MQLGLHYAIQKQAEYVQASLKARGAHLKTHGARLKTRGASLKTRGASLKTRGASLKTRGARVWRRAPAALVVFNNCMMCNIFFKKLIFPLNEVLFFCFARFVFRKSIFHALLDRIFIYLSTKIKHLSFHLFIRI